MKKETIYEERRMRSKGAYHYFFKESGSDAWKHHNWEGPAIQPIEGEETEYKKEYYLYGKQLTIEEWEEARKNREGLPWYKNPSMRGTTRF
jgi:hypothetical protein